MTDEGDDTKYRRAVGVCYWIEDALLVITLGGMIVLAAVQIALRNAFDSGLVWADPLLRLMVLWVGLLGAMAASRSQKHIAIDVITRALSGRSKAWVQLGTSLFTATVSGIIAFYAIRLVVEDFKSRMTIFVGVPAWAGEVIIPLAFAVICLRYLLLGVEQAKVLLRSA